jgi:hypothetical protein
MITGIELQTAAGDQVDIGTWALSASPAQIEEFFDFAHEAIIKRFDNEDVQAACMQTVYTLFTRHMTAAAVERGLTIQ